MSTVNTIGFSSAQDALSKLKGSGHILINSLADACPACQAFKQDLPDLVTIAQAKGIQVYNIKASEENKEFFEKYQSETIPYTFVFSNGEFVGGDSFDKESFGQLVNALGEIHES